MPMSPSKQQNQQNKQSQQSKKETKPSPEPKKSEKAKSSASASTSAAKSSPSLKEPTREVVYPDYDASLAVGDEAITETDAMEKIGWREASANVPVSPNQLAWKLEDGTRVQCYNNVKNRYVVQWSVRMLMNVILQGLWRFNGEPIIIGKTGLILNGQHCLMALVLAVREWRAHPDKYPFWDSEPTLEKLLVYGINEDDETVNTMDTCKPRSLGDAIYRSEYFNKYKLTGKSKQKLAKICEHAIRFVWDRTGAGGDIAFGRHALMEFLDFLGRHPKLVACVKHVYDEDRGKSSDGKNEDGKLAHFAPLGTMAGLMYLMAACGSDPDKKGGYFQSEMPSESQLDMSSFDDASEFLTALAQGNKELQAIRSTLAAAKNEDGLASRAERIAILVNAWNVWSANKKVTPETIRLKYVKDDEGFKHVVPPCLDGIDILHRGEAN